MMNELKVFYKGEKGLISYEGKKVIFQHRDFRNDKTKEGLGIILDKHRCEKENYTFGVFKNVPTVIPTKYLDVKFFFNRGVPVKIEKGYYGDNILLKEYYNDRTYIRAYKGNGEIGLFESEVVNNDNYKGPNIYYQRINNLITNWEDVTSEIVDKIEDSVSDLTCDLDLENEVVKNVLCNFYKNDIYRLENGVIVADGKFESLLIWSEGSEVKMSWFGRKLNLEKFAAKKIREGAKTKSVED